MKIFDALSEARENAGRNWLDNHKLGWVVLIVFDLYLIANAQGSKPRDHLVPGCLECITSSKSDL